MKNRKNVKKLPFGRGRGRACPTVCGSARMRYCGSPSSSSPSSFSATFVDALNGPTIDEFVPSDCRNSAMGDTFGSASLAHNYLFSPGAKDWKVDSLNQDDTQPDTLNSWQIIIEKAPKKSKRATLETMKRCYSTAMTTHSEEANFQSSLYKYNNLGI